MSVRKAELLLAAVIIARSTSLLFVKVGLGTISPFNLIAARFCLAFVILSVIFYKRLLHCSVRDMKCGAALGARSLSRYPLRCSRFVLSHPPRFLF